MAVQAVFEWAKIEPTESMMAGRSVWETEYAR